MFTSWEIAGASEETPCSRGCQQQLKKHKQPREAAVESRSPATIDWKDQQAWENLHCKDTGHYEDTAICPEQRRDTPRL